MTIESLRQQHPALVYQGYRLAFNEDGTSLKLKFELLLEPDVVFFPSVEINNLDPDRARQLPASLLEQLVFHLGLAELPSYWKCACPPLIKIKAGSLNQQQQTWWLDLFQTGMGEFYYTNQIDFSGSDFLRIEARAPQPEKNVPWLEKIAPRPNQEPLVLSASHYQLPYLVPIGGGKDSGLVLGLLDQKSKHANSPSSTFPNCASPAYPKYHSLILEPASPAASKLVSLSNCAQLIVVKRTIDPNLLKLNSQGYLNGHTPFSAYLAFLTTLVAHLGGFQQILLGNESSANQGNLHYQDLHVNHQYSKSYHFEKSFRQYAAQYLGSAPKQAEYLSLLRPLNELQIARSFAHLAKYLPVFKSCNASQQQDAWCEQCAKCLFVFVMLYPFVELPILTQQVFLSNLFEDNSLLPSLLDLADETRNKPLECVGTDQEVRAALWLAVQKHTHENLPLPPLLARIKELVLDKYHPEKLDTLTQQLLQSWNKQHFLDEKLENLLKLGIQFEKKTL